MKCITSIDQKIHRKQVQNYKKTFRHFLLTSRFSNQTWTENQIYRNQHKQIGCIYCAPDPISQVIPQESIMFILEMNNDTNKILGIGMVRNNPKFEKHYVYNNGNYNRYVYTGKIRIDRSEMVDEEELIMQVFDILCFQGNRHMKRGQGIKSFPADILYRCSKRIDLVQFISNMFKKRLAQK
jgi:hypothetical protein